MIVEPERDVPGTMDNTWKRPIKNAVLYVISSSFSTFGVYRIILGIAVIAYFALAA